METFYRMRGMNATKENEMKCSTTGICVTDADPQRESYWCSELHHNISVCRLAILS